MAKPDKPLNEADLIKSFEAAGVVEYLEYLRSGKRLMWVNFRAGIARGLGLTLGATMVLGLFIWLITQLVSLPVVGEYFEKLQTLIVEYQESTNYTDELEEMQRLLGEIRDRTGS